MHGKRVLLLQAKRTKLPLIYINYIKKTPKLYLNEHAILYRICLFQLYLKYIFYVLTHRQNGCYWENSLNLWTIYGIYDVIMMPSSRHDLCTL